jgi:hypothetical protein
VVADCGGNAHHPTAGEDRLEDEYVSQVHPALVRVVHADDVIGVDVVPEAR